MKNVTVFISIFPITSNSLCIAKVIKLCFIDFDYCNRIPQCFICK